MSKSIKLKDHPSDFGEKMTEMLLHSTDIEAILIM